MIMMMHVHVALNQLNISDLICLTNIQEIIIIYFINNFEDYICFCHYLKKVFQSPYYRKSNHKIKLWI